jgi:hypothetical protein
VTGADRRLRLIGTTGPFAVSLGLPLSMAKRTVSRRKTKEPEPDTVPLRAGALRRAWILRIFSTRESRGTLIVPSLIRITLTGAPRSKLAIRAWGVSAAVTAGAPAGLSVISGLVRRSVSTRMRPRKSAGRSSEILTDGAAMDSTCGRREGLLSSNQPLIETSGK